MYLLLEHILEVDVRLDASLDHDGSLGLGQRALAPEREHEVASNGA